MSDTTDGARRPTSASNDKRSQQARRASQQEKTPTRTQRPRKRAAQQGSASGQQRNAGTAKQPRRAVNRAVGVEPARRGSDRHDPRPTSNERRNEGVRVPLVPALAVLVASVVAAVFITRAVVLSSVVQTTKGATEAASSSTTTEATPTVEVKDTSNGGNESEAKTGDTTSKDASTSGNDSSTSSSSSSSFSAKKGSGVKSPWTTSGTFSSGDETLDEEVKTFCDGIATKDMDQDTALLEVYKGIAWSEYVERDDAQHPSGKDWRIEYARKYYEHDCSGNCYEFAAFLSYCLQYLGLDDAHAEGVLVELKSGGWGDHGLVYVTNTDGTACLCDTSLGTNGWMLKESSYNVQLQDFENA